METMFARKQASPIKVYKSNSVTCVCVSVSVSVCHALIQAIIIHSNHASEETSE